METPAEQEPHKEPTDFLKQHHKQMAEAIKQRAEHLTAQLSEWQGASAQIWGYTVSHNHLVLRLWRGDYHRGEDEVYLMCLICESISGPVIWKDARLQVGAVAGEGSNRLVLLDPKAGVTVVCGRIDVVPLPEPMFQKSRPK